MVQGALICASILLGFRLPQALAVAVLEHRPAAASWYSGTAAAYATPHQATYGCLNPVASAIVLITPAGVPGQRYRVLQRWSACVGLHSNNLCSDVCRQVWY